MGKVTSYFLYFYPIQIYDNVMGPNLIIKLLPSGESKPVGLVYNRVKDQVYSMR